LRINGTYVRASECRLREELVHARLNTFVEEIRNRETADREIGGV
jgi:hypothetical protein